MDTCYPALTTAALFFTFMIIDLIRRNYRALAGHFLFGAVAVLLMLYLCQSDAELVAWGLIAVPIIFLILGFVIGTVKPGPEPVPAPAATLVPSAVTPTKPTSYCYSCGNLPCVCPVHQPSSSPGGAIKDTSGNVVIPAPASATPTQVPPPANACGPDAPGGSKTQCVDARTLASV